MKISFTLSAISSQMSFLAGSCRDSVPVQKGKYIHLVPGTNPNNQRNSILLSTAINL